MMSMRLSLHIPSFEKRGEPWFTDGNILLVTDESHVCFRVHRGVLSRHSEMFQGMFEMPSPSDVDLVDGCQVVTMYDIPNELSNLLNALYDGVSFQSRNIDNFFYLVGILRLSTKYLINHLRLAAVRYLTKTWSDTLAGHDLMVETAIRSPIVDNMSYPYVHPLFVLNLARETNVRIVIPSALYFLSLYPLDDLLKADHAKLRVNHPSRPSSSLCSSDIRDYTLMFQHRLDVILDFVRRMCGERVASPNCLNGKSCTRSFARLTTRLSRSWMTRTGPLHYMMQAVLDVTEDSSFCAPCQRAFKRDVASLREKIWENLPAVVGLPSWKEMRVSDLDKTEDVVDTDHLAHTNSTRP